MILCFFHAKRWFLWEFCTENLVVLPAFSLQNCLKFFLFLYGKQPILHKSYVGARHACAQCWAPWVRPVTPPRDSAAAGQGTQGTSATSVRMVGASGTAAADRELWDLFIHCKKKVNDFPVPRPGCHLPNSPWRGIISDIPAADRDLWDLFIRFFLC